MLDVQVRAGLPPALFQFIAEKARTGAALHKPVALNTVVPSAGPVEMDLGGFYKLVIYPGVLPVYRAVPVLGRKVDTLA